jgi:two-component system, sporulation sensor kinase E
MNHCHFSYCFETESGGIHVKNNMEKVRTHISFLMKDGSRPGLTVELDGTIIEKNDVFCKMLYIGKTQNIKELMDESAIELWESFLKRAYVEERTLFDMFCIQISLNETYTVKMHLTYFEELRIVVAILDIPKSYEKVSEMTYLNVFRKSKDFEVIVDSTGIIRDVNEMHFEFFNESRDYFVGKTADLFFHLFSDYHDETFTVAERLETHGFAEKTRCFERSPGDIRYYHITAFHDKETNMYVVRMKDRTDKVKLEQQLDHSGSLSAVGQIAASIAHEIRNPMTTLKGFVQLLKISATTDTTKYLSVIDEELARMELILSEMLTLSKPSMNKKTTFSLGVLVADMIQIVHPKALMDGITITQKENTLRDTMIIGDSDKIKQVLLNLLKNALEAMSPGGILTISVKLDDFGKVILGISDTGKGMDKSQVKQVFMPFYTTKADGTGLGLPFVLKVIEEHGGTIAVESAVNKGTSFIVTLPSAIAHSRGVDSNEKKVLST